MLTKTYINRRRIIPSLRNTIKTDHNIIAMSVIQYSHYELIQMKMKKLKQICKERNLKLSGKKKLLVERIMQDQYDIKSILKIQKVGRGYLVRKYMKYKGTLSTFTNDEDFLTLDSFKDDICFHDRFAYTDDCGFTYGFHICSIMQLIERNDYSNPYTRKPFSNDIKKHVRSMIRLGKLLSIPIHYKYKIEKAKTVEKRLERVFMEIERLGFIVHSSDFLQLRKDELIVFFKELYDIWNYRVDLTNEIKRHIVHPDGNLFRNIPRNITFHNIKDIQQYCVIILERLVIYVHDNSFKQTSIIYALGALTLASRTFAESLPWLFESFRYSNSW